MSDFCEQCSTEILGEDTGDMRGIAGPLEVASVLCEGCGPTHVDSEGSCIYHAGRTSEECYKDVQDSQLAFNFEEAK